MSGRQNAGSCELYYMGSSVTCVGKRYLLPKRHPPCLLWSRSQQQPWQANFSLYYQRMKIQLAAGDGRSSTKVVLPENEIQLAAGDGRSSTKVVLPKNVLWAGIGEKKKERKSSRPPETAVPVLKLFHKRT